jgi:hypothetical protein
MPIVGVEYINIISPMTKQGGSTEKPRLSGYPAAFCIATATGIGYHREADEFAGE